MVLFFVLSGAVLEVPDLRATASLTLAYVLLRVLGRIAGGWLGALLAGRRAFSGFSLMIGMAVLPQAGVAIGLALVASQRLPEGGAAILSATVAGTVLFELAGPVLTRLALVRAGETRSSREPAPD